MALSREALPSTDRPQPRTGHDVVALLGSLRSASHSFRGSALPRRALARGEASRSAGQRSWARTYGRAPTGSCRSTDMARISAGVARSATAVVVGVMLGAASPTTVMADSAWASRTVKCGFVTNSALPLGGMFDVRATNITCRRARKALRQFRLGPAGPKLPGWRCRDVSYTEEGGTSRCVRNSSVLRFITYRGG